MTKYIIAVAVGAVLASFSSQAATASRYFTLKIGDLILIENGEWHNAEINSRVTARLGDFESINIKIK